MVNVYARETTQTVSVAGVPAAAASGSAGGSSEVRAPLRRNDYAPLAAWRELQYIDAEGREAAASYNRMRVRLYIIVSNRDEKGFQYLD